METNLDELIANEKRQVALEYQHEAWAGGMSDGIDMEIMAEAAIATAVTELCEAAGEDAVIAYIDALRERVLTGTFLPRTLQ